MASTIVSRTQSGSESAAGRRTWTFSCWFKRNGLSSSQELFGTDANGARSNNYNIIDLNASNQIDFSGYESGTTFRKTTTRVFRDTNAWYHLVIAFDSTQSTADDRIKIYINGVRETSFGTSTNPAQDHQSKFFSSGKIHAFGRSSQTFDGVISHCHATEGTAYAPTVFGSTDATTGEWKINTSPSVSYGTNGFFLFKDDNAVTNQAGNSSGNFAVTAGTLTKTEDCPSNVFATINNLVPSNISSLSNGNTTLTQSSASVAIATLGFQGGKYYWEVKNSNQQSYTQLVGILRQARMASSGNTGYDVGTNDGGWGYFMQSNADNGKAYHNGTLSSVYQTTSVNDILQVAVDGTAGKIWWGVNGTWLNSGDPANGTNAIYTNLPTDDILFPAFSNYSSAQLQINFGNGYFGTTEITTNTGTGFQDADGNGRFYYTVPANYRCLSTKGLNQ